MISANKYFSKKIAKESNFDIRHDTHCFVFINLSLLLAKLAGAIAMPQSYAYCLIIIGNCNHQTFSASIIVPYLFLKQIKSNLSLYSLYYAEVCTEFAGPISASLRPGNSAPFVEMLQRWRAVDKTVSDSIGPRFEPQTSRFRDKRVTSRPTGRYAIKYFTILLN